MTEVMQALIQLSSSVLVRLAGDASAFTSASRVSDAWTVLRDGPQLAPCITLARSALLRHPLPLLATFLDRAADYADEGSFLWASLSQEFKCV